MKVLLDSLAPNTDEGEKTDRIKIVVGMNAYLIEEYEGGLKLTKTSIGADNLSIEPAYANQIKLK